jgi:hypothetical protein
VGKVRRYPAGGVCETKEAKPEQGERRRCIIPTVNVDIDAVQTTVLPQGIAGVGLKQQIAGQRPSRWVYAQAQSSGSGLTGSRPDRLQFGMDFFRRLGLASVSVDGPVAEQSQG